MSMSGSSKRRTTLAEINVTPMVDVMLVLLIMFMVTVPMMQQGIEVNLPETASSGVATTDKPLILIVSAKRKIMIGKAEVTLDTIRTKLKAIIATRKNKQIYIQADKKVDYGTVAEIMGEIRAAGVYNIGLITLPKSR